MSNATWLCGSLIVAACAQAGGTQQQLSIDAPEQQGQKDAAVSVAQDAKVYRDAPVSHLDAFVPQDAPLSQEGGLCTDNTNCVSGTCCLVAFCIAGTPIGTSLCLPDN